MFKFCPLFSSSSGNCVYIGGAEGGVLVDAGISAKRTELALWEIGVDPKSIRAVFVTHEHSDHVCGLRVFAKRHKLPVYATAGTIAALEENAADSYECFEVHRNGTEAAGFLFEAFPTSHDTQDSCGYRITLPDGSGAAIATDLGIVTPEVFAALSGCELVMLESNHDVEMLRSGPYPYWVKKRILSDRGHLSNEACARAAAQLIQSGVTRLILGHLSKENNYPALAYEHTGAALSAIGARAGRDYTLEIACAPPDIACHRGSRRRKVINA